MAGKIVAFTVGVAAIYLVIARAYGTSKDGWELLGDLLKVWRWLELLSPETTLLLVVAVGASAAATVDHWWPVARRLIWDASVAKTSWETELYSHRLDRREFWRLLEAAYSNWTMKPEPGRSLRDVVQATKMPSDLPLADNTKFPEWAWAAESHCAGDDAKQLLRFASAIYTAAKPPMAVKSQLMGSSQEFDRFDTFRMELSKFWDHWGRQEPLEPVVREQKADAIIKAHADEIKMLTFLEVARVRWADSGLPGKSGLFRLGRRNAETGT